MEICFKYSSDLLYIEHFFEKEKTISDVFSVNPKLTISYDINEPVICYEIEIPEVLGSEVNFNYCSFNTICEKTIYLYDKQYSLSDFFIRGFGL